MFNSPRPDFADPPVIEVVLSLQFDPLSRLGLAHLGGLWGLYEKDFPNTEDKTPLSPAFESFEPPKHQPLRFEFISEPPPPRCWFINSKGTELIQVQRDRFVLNWRETESKEPYPRYEKVRENFDKYFNKFENYVISKNIGSITPNQCEVTYVNHILPGKVWSRLGQFEKIFSFWSGRYTDRFLDEPEDVRFQIRYRILNEEGKPIGRLHVSAEPRIKLDDGSPLVRLTLTARGAPRDKGLAGVTAFFDLAREHIVRGFASLTTKHMHQLWGRTDA